jgi:hypothetical protein
MLRGREKVDPGQGFSGSDSQGKTAKPETEPKNGNHKVFYGMHRCDGRSFYGGGFDTNLAVREQQKARKAFLGVGITSCKHQSLRSAIEWGKARMDLSLCFLHQNPLRGS